MIEEKDYNPPTAFPPKEWAPEKEEEELEFLKREEVKTMEKDIAVLREREAQRERERIIALTPKVKKPKPKKEKPDMAEAEKEKKEEVEKVSLIPKIAKRPFPSKKLLIRGAILLLFLLFLVTLFWFLGSKPPLEEEIIPFSEEETAPSTEEEKEEIYIPLPLISVENIKTPEVSKNEEIPAVFTEIMQEEIKEGTFLQVAIKNIEQNRLVSLEDLSAAFQIMAPEEIYQKLKKDYTLAIFAQKQGKRMVLVGKVKEKEGLDEILKNWEAKIKEDGLWAAGEKIQTLVPYFRTTFYQNVDFRYLSISRDDLGVCYAQFDDYFVITSSFESIKRVIDEIKSGELNKEIGQLFIVGFEGKNLTPQLEEFFRKYQPGGVLLLSKNIESKEQLKKLIDDLQNLSLKETGLPLLVAADQEGGIISRVDFLEEKTPQSDIESSEAAYQIGLTRGQELKELGINLNLAPLLDFIQEGDFLFERSFQKSPEYIGELGKALVSGQKKAGILTAIKHFPGYAGISFNPEEKLAEIEKTPQISQFQKALEAGPELVMTSNVIYKEIDSVLPFTFSPKAIQLLKNSLGTDILIISDDLNSSSLLKKFSLKEIVVKPVEAGIDIMIFSGYRSPAEQDLETFFSAFKNGEVSKTKVKEAISKIIQLKESL